MCAKRVMIVDDENDILTVAQASLETLAGWEVLVARSGQEGIDLAEAENPDAILLDVMMPDMDGPTTFQKLQNKVATRHIPVVLLTAKSQPSDHERFTHLGMSAIVLKPFDPLRLPIYLRAILGWNE